VLRVELTIEIARPPADVFDYLTDVEKLPLWQKSLIEVHCDRPLAEGSRLVELRSLFGRQAETEHEVSVFEPARRLTLQAIRGPVQLEVDHELQEAGAGTKLHVRAEGRPTGILRVAGPALAASARQELKRDFERLKAILEE